PPPHPTHPLSLPDALPICSYEDTMVRALDDPVHYTAEPHVDEVDRIAFAPGGETLVSGGDDELVLWDVAGRAEAARADGFAAERSEEHTSELQSRENLVCR